MALSRLGRAYTWGYNGKGLLGRPKETENYLPLEIGIAPGEFTIKPPTFEEMI
jgi:alpha-tubulin suppressor-like RCC1 family protein